MRIIFKNIWSNILFNKKRTIILALCMAVAAFSAMICFSLTTSIKGVLLNITMQEFGDARISTASEVKTDKELIIPDNAEALYMFMADIEMQSRSADNFIYATKEKYYVIGFDVEKARKKGYLPYDESLSLGEHDIIITQKLADKKNMNVGDTIDIKTPDDEEITLNIKYVLPNEKYLKSKGTAVISSSELARKINGSDGWSFCDIAVESGADIEEVLGFLRENNPKTEFNDIYADDETFMLFNIMFMGIFMIFALIIFIVVSGIQEHVIRERTAQLGTLRSIGATKGMAAISLIAENLFYAVPGAVIGIICYLPVDTFLLDSLLILPQNSEISFEYPKIKASAVIIVILVTILIACASSLKAILKAVKTPIRDIIFGNRDSAYILNTKKSITGLVLIIAGLVCGLFMENAVIIILSLAMITAGTIMFMPMLLKFISGKFSKGKNPVSNLAVKNLSAKKTLVSSAVLYAAVISLVSAVMLTVGYIIADASNVSYSGNIILTELEQSAEKYGFIEQLDGVKEVKLVYRKYQKIEINGVPEKSNDFTIIGYGGDSPLYNGISGLPEYLAEDEVSIDEYIMNRNGIKEGDNIELTLNADGERPIKLNLKAVKGCNTSVENAGSRDGLAINLDTFKKWYYDYPSALAVALDDPQDTEAVKEKISTYLMDKYAQIYTYEEYVAFSNSGNDMFYLILYLIIGIGSLLSIIMLATNQSIGFEQRKKELAVLHSTAMSREQLKKLLFRETAIFVFISTIWALIFGIVEYVIIFRFVSALSIVSTEVKLHMTGMFILAVVLYLIALITATGNGKRINSMNTAEQMKYE